ncbi:MAG: hypothetical protein LBD35_03890 [Prevotellaceae bacterium]|jgi:hypothetical protein|nr:hypothetical protein [Prevotellaceae bacterium]
MQCAIVRDDDKYDPVVRHPDAALLDMRASVAADGKTDTIRLVVYNRGSASISEMTPVSFYDAGTAGESAEPGVFLTRMPAGADIFPNEIVELEYVLVTEGSFINRRVRARIMDDGTTFPAAGYSDCDPSNNAMAASDCPGLEVETGVRPGNAVCGAGATVRLSVVGKGGGAVSYGSAPVFQWHKDNAKIAGATDSVLYVFAAGEYHCEVQDNTCIARTNRVAVRVDYGGYNPPALRLAGSPASGRLCNPAGAVVVSASGGYANPQYFWYRDGQILAGLTDSSIAASEAGLYRLDIVTDGCMVTDTFRVMQTADSVAVVGSIALPALPCGGGVPNLTPPAVNDNGGAITAEGWQLSATAGDFDFRDFDPQTPLTLSDHGKRLRYRAANYCGEGYSDTATVAVTDKPTIASIGTLDAICNGSNLDIGKPAVADNNSGIAEEGWMLETDTGSNRYSAANLPLRVTESDNGKRIFRSARNGCGTSSSDTASVAVHPRMVYPDIRIQLRPDPARSICLSSYLDTLNFKSVKWSAASGGASGLADSTTNSTGKVHTGKLSPGTHIYRYRIESLCDTGTARVFARNTKRPVVRFLSDTLMACRVSPLSSCLQLNQIMGLEADGEWSCEPELEEFVAVAAESSQFAGARVFNGSEAWVKLKDNAKFKHPNALDAAMFKFKYASRQIIIVIK